MSGSVVLDLDHQIADEVSKLLWEKTDFHVAVREVLTGYEIDMKDWDYYFSRIGHLLGLRRRIKPRPPELHLVRSKYFNKKQLARMVADAKLFWLRESRRSGDYHLIDLEDD